MRKNNGSPKRAKKRHRKEVKHKAKRAAHSLHLWETFRKYGKLDIMPRPAPGEKYLTEIFDQKKKIDA